jgi:maleate isomerase
MPYQRPLAEQVVGYLEAEGFAVADWRALEVADNREVGCIPGDRVMDAARSLNLDGADALVISACVQMPSLAGLGLPIDIPDAGRLLRLGVPQPA